MGIIKKYRTRSNKKYKIKSNGKYKIKSSKNPRPLISLKDISLSFGNRKILDNVSFKINYGEILGMLGPNGVGKSEANQCSSEKQSPTRLWQIKKPS